MIRQSGCPWCGGLAKFKVIKNNDVLYPDINCFTWVAMVCSICKSQGPIFGYIETEFMKNEEKVIRARVEVDYQFRKQWDEELKEIGKDE